MFKSSKVEGGEEGREKSTSYKSTSDKSTSDPGVRGDGRGEIKYSLLHFGI